MPIHSTLESGVRVIYFPSTIAKHMIGQAIWKPNASSANSTLAVLLTTGHWKCYREVFFSAA